MYCVVSLQLRLMELEKEQFRAALARQHQEEVDRLVREHGAKMKRAAQERNKVSVGTAVCISAACGGGCSVLKCCVKHPLSFPPSLSPCSWRTCGGSRSRSSSS